jgi:hypothetical protein
LFPLGGLNNSEPIKRLVTTTLTSSAYINGKWRIKGKVTRLESPDKPWEARIGFVAESDSGPGEHMRVSNLTTNKKTAQVSNLVSVQELPESFESVSGGGTERLKRLDRL